MPLGDRDRHIIQPGYIGYSQAPTPFNPVFASFNVRLAAEASHGTYGLVCQQVDDRHFYLIEVNPEMALFSIYRFQGTNLVSLLEPEWQPAVGLHTDSGATNTIAAWCYPELITVYINNEIVADIQFVDGYYGTMGMALFAASFEDSGPEGFKVFFDNLEMFIPQQ